MHPTVTHNLLDPLSLIWLVAVNLTVLARGLGV